MKTIKQMIDDLKQSLKNTLTKDSSKEDIDRVDGFCKELDNVEQGHNQVVKEKQDITEMYIKAVKNQGTTEKPKEETPTEPRSLEDIAKEVVEKDNATK